MLRISSSFLFLVVVGILIVGIECCRLACKSIWPISPRCVYSHGQYRHLDLYDDYIIQTCQDPSIVLVGKDRCEFVPKFEDRYKCDTDCDREEVDQPGPVCGTNDVTYANTCELFQDKSCRNDTELDVGHAGYCSVFNGYKKPLGDIYGHRRRLEEPCSNTIYY